jgi:hypothetical protein
MNFSEGVQKISFPIIEPYLYVRPSIVDSPVPMVAKIYSSENSFNSNAFKEFRKQFQENDSKLEKDYNKGSLLDILV